MLLVPCRQAVLGKVVSWVLHWGGKMHSVDDYPRMERALTKIWVDTNDRCPPSLHNKSFTQDKAILIPSSMYSVFYWVVNTDHHSNLKKKNLGTKELQILDLECSLWKMIIWESAPVSSVMRQLLTCLLAKSHIRKLFSLNKSMIDHSNSQEWVSMHEMYLLCQI